MAKKEEGVIDEMSSSFLSNLASDILCSPVNLSLLAVCIYLLYKIFASPNSETDAAPPTPQLLPMKKKDMTYEELKKYDGLNEEGRMCVAVNWKIFDVTRGKHFYGPGGPYASFAGKDATRCFATFTLEGARDEYDDLADLDSVQMDSAKEWELQLQEKYPYVGRLLKPGEEPNEYSDDEEAKQK